MNNHQPASATQPSVATQKGPIAPDFTASASDAAQLKVCTDHSLLVSSTEKYLELCLNTGEYDVSLAEIAISSAQQIINSDGELFQEIRQRYQKTRGLIRSLNLRLFKPINIHFVEVSCFGTHHVQIPNVLSSASKTVTLALSKVHSPFHSKKTYNLRNGNSAPVLAHSETLRPCQPTSFSIISIQNARIHDELGSTDFPRNSITASIRIPTWVPHTLDGKLTVGVYKSSKVRTEKPCCG